MLCTAEEQAAHRKLWIDALRSGTYKQAQHHLRLGDAFCCLGVACELYRQEHPDTSKWNEYNEDFIIGNRSQGKILPKLVQDWLGLRTPDGGFLGQRYLTFDNDAGHSFEEIADIIESAPKGLLAE